MGVVNGKPYLRRRDAEAAQAEFDQAQAIAGKEQASKAITAAMQHVPRETGEATSSTEQGAPAAGSNEQSDTSPEKGLANTTRRSRFTAERAGIRI